MALKAVSMLGRWRLAGLFFLLVVPFAELSAAQNAPAPQPSPAPFNEKTASSLLMEFSQGLTTHIENRFVTLFDFSQMKGGAIFRQQIRLLFTQTDYIRVHMNLVETKPGGEKGTMVLDAEMEAQPLTSEPPWRRNDRL